MTTTSTLSLLALNHSNYHLYVPITPYHISLVASNDPLPLLPFPSLCPLMVSLLLPHYSLPSSQCLYAPTFHLLQEVPKVSAIRYLHVSNHLFVLACFAPEGGGGLCLPPRHALERVCCLKGKKDGMWNVERVELRFKHWRCECGCW